MQKSLTLLVVLAAPVTLAAQDFRGRGDGDEVWEALSAKYDKDKDGRIDADEYRRGAGKFQALDRNADGVLTASDFEGAGRHSRFGRRLSSLVARAADADASDDVTSAEWKRFLASLGAGEDGVVEQEKLRSAVRKRGTRRGGPRGEPGSRRGRRPSMMRIFDHDGDGRLEIADLEALFADLDRDNNGVLETAELGRRIPRDREAPEQDDRAPDFELPYATDQENTARLSSFANKRPVALVFGSYT